MDPNEVTGPDRLDTEEQIRTRKFHAAEESDTKRDMMHDDKLSTMQQNLMGGGLDDRGVEGIAPDESDRADDELNA